MKSFSNLLEKAETPSVKDNLAQGRANRKFEKKFNKKLSPQDLERIDSSRLSDIERDARGKSGEKIRQSVVKSQGQDDLLDKINKNRQRPVKKGDKIYGKPTGVDVSTGKGKYVPPKEIQGRSTYIDPKTNKASQKGIKSYITKARQMRTGSNIPVDSKTTDSIAKISKSEYADKINQKYGGRRAKRAYSNAPSLSDVQKQVDLKDRLKQKYGKGEYRRGSVTKTKVVKQSEISKLGKEYTAKINAEKNKVKSPWKPSDFKKPPSTNPDLTRARQMGASGMDSNLGGGAGGTTGSKKFKDFTKVGNKGQLKNLKTPPIKGGDLVKPVKGGDLVGPLKGGTLTKVKKGSDLVTQSANLGKLSQTKLKGDLKKFSDFRKTATPLLGKNVSKNLTKTSVGKVAKGLLKGAGSKVGAGAIDTAYGYNQYRDKGHSKAGSLVRGAIKGSASALGFAGGALAGGLAGGGVASLAVGAAGGLTGSALTGSLADKIIGSVDKKLKLKTPKKYQKDSYKKNQSKITGGGTSGGSISGPGKGSSGNFTPLSLGTSTKDYNKGQSAPWKTKKESVEYVQERTRLKDRPQVQALRNTVKPFMNQGKVTVTSNNATGTPQPIQTQRPVPTQTTSTPVAKPVVPQAPVAKPVVPQAPVAKPVAPQAPQAQARPGRTVGAPQGTGRPGAMVRVGSAINAVRSALSNKGPIQGRQTGAQRRVAQSQVRANRPAPVTPTRPIRGQGNRPIAGNQNRQGGTTPVAKPVTQAPVAKPVQAAPVAKPAPQLTGAQRAQQMAKQRIAQGRNTVTGELKSKPKVRKIASPMDMDY